MPFDPFGDHSTRGYLRNVAGEADPDRLRRLEYLAFSASLPAALAGLRQRKSVDYAAMLATHRILFGSVYPWAGQDRLTTAPGIAIAKGGIADLFAHPRDIERAADYALSIARDPARMRASPGEVFGALAYAHPFLDTNGRSIMTVHADLTRRAGFHIDWQAIDKPAFLAALTEELRQPGRAMDRLLAPHIRPGALQTERTRKQLASHAGLNARTPAGPGPSAGPGM